MSTPGNTPALPPLWLLVLITFSGTVAMHIFVPALPAAAQALQASPGAIQLTIGLYILGLAIGQPIYGPLSDAFGRRPVLLAGLALFTLGGIASIVAPDVRSLCVARLVQALGGGAGLVLGRAIVRDTGNAVQSVRRLALINLVTMVGPAMAPLLGQGLVDTLGWRFIFGVLVLLGMCNMFFTWRVLPETSRPSGILRPSTFARDYLRLLRSRAFLGYAIGGGAATCSMYAFMVAAPFMFVNEMHRPAHEVAFYLAMIMVGMSVGNALTSRLIGRVSAERLLMRGNRVSLLSALLLLAVVSLGWMNWLVVLGLVVLFTLGAGMTSPAALTRTLSVEPKLVGSAAGLYGSIQMSIGAACTALAGLGADPTLAVALILSSAAVLSHVCFRMARHHAPRLLPGVV